MSVRSIWLTMLFNSSAYFLIFYLVILFIIEKGILKSMTVIIDLVNSITFNS